MNMIDLREREIAEAHRANLANEEEKRQARYLNAITSAVGLILTKGGRAAKAAGVAKRVKDFTNDAEWYKKYPWLVLNPSKIPFYYVKSNLLFNSQLQVVTPGVLEIQWTPTFPVDNLTADRVDGFGQSSSLIRAASDMMSAVYQYIKVDRNYDQRDVSNYIVTFDSILSVIAMVTRLLQGFKVSDESNMYLTKKIVGMLANKANFSDADIVTYTGLITEIERTLNSLIETVNSFCIPDLPLYHRHMFLNGKGFKDDAGTRAEMYFFRQLHFYFPSFTDQNHGVYNGTTRVNAYPITDASLGTADLKVSKAFDFTNILQDPADVIQLLDSLNDCLLANKPAMSYVSADLRSLRNLNDANLKLYYDFIELGGVDYSTLEPLQFTYDTEMLEQIHNATIFNGTLTNIVTTGAPSTVVANTTALWYLPDKGTVRYGMVSAQNGNLVNLYHLYPISFTVAYANYFTADDTFLDAINSMDPTTDEILTMSRLHTGFIGYANASAFGGRSSHGLEPATRSTELCMSGVFWVDVANAGTFDLTTVTLATFQAAANLGNIADYFTRFDWMPYMHITSGNSSSNYIIRVVGDIINPAVINSLNLNNLHIGCCRSETGLINYQAGGSPTGISYKYNGSDDKKKNPGYKKQKPNKRDGSKEPGTGDGSK